MVNWDSKILEGFALKEARCHGWEGVRYHDCGQVWLVDDLCDALERLRGAYGNPIIVTSWLRCKIHNKAIGGVANSYHMNGHAVDIRTRSCERLDVLMELARAEFPFVKRYATFIHCDIRGERPG